MVPRRGSGRSRESDVDFGDYELSDDICSDCGTVKIDDICDECGAM